MKKVTGAFAVNFSMILEAEGLQNLPVGIDDLPVPVQDEADQRDGIPEAVVGRVTLKKAALPGQAFFTTSFRRGKMGQFGGHSLFSIVHNPLTSNFPPFHHTSGPVYRKR
jgi:hypothetical protein